MKFGVSINPGRPLIQEIDSVSSWGPDFVEIYVEPPLNTIEMLAKKAPLICKTLQKHNISMIGHAPWWFDLGSPDINTRATCLIEMKKIIKTLPKLGIKKLDVHGSSTGMGFLSPAANAIVMDNLVSSFALLVETAKPFDITISVENTSESPEEIRHLLTKVDGLSATFDIGHAFTHGGMPALKSFLAMKEVDHLHIHDATTVIDHMPIGDGRISFKQVAELLRKRDYSSTATIEVIGTKTGARQSLDKFRDLMKT